MTRCMEKENSLGPKAKNTKGSTFKIRSKEEAHFIMVMDLSMKDNGTREDNMAEESSKIN